MAARTSGRFRIVRILALALAGLLAIFVEVAPLDFTTAAHPSPDLLYGVVAYWTVRRPGSAPVVLIFALGLCRDLLADVPVGAGALTLVLAAEFLRTRGVALTRRPFIAEWLLVTAIWFAMIAGQVLLTVLTLAQPPFLVDLLWQGLYGAAIYPAIALCVRWVLRIGWRIAAVPGAADSAASPGRRA